uniref:Serine/arginine-rich splicing factor 2 n=1 Tax=Heliconius erato TaxID=33431 RepID=L7X3W9_HELEA|nr:serine/arginine-rich splicing factor 2-like protein [Heliconius erato]
MSYGRPPPRIDGMVSLKVDNLTYRTTPEDLRRVFERCGDVGDIYIPRDRYTRESRGFAFVRFYDRRDAEEALDSLDGRMLDGRELRVQMARYGRPSSPYRTTRVHGLVHVVDPGLVRGSVRTPEAVPVLAPGPGLARTRRALAVAPVAAAAAVHAQDIEILGRVECSGARRW